eukprot:1143632-Pelagomonas_calceolata.AAC.2
MIVPSLWLHEGLQWAPQIWELSLAKSKVGSISLAPNLEATCSLHLCPLPWFKTGPKTGYTGHTGLTRSQASTTTLPSKTILEGAMIPRFCQVGMVGCADANTCTTGDI